MQVSSKAFNRSHLRPGTVSWCVREADDPDYVRSRVGYENAEFLITTGAAPPRQVIIYAILLLEAELIELYCYL